jgi:murein DD-endopeptidase MepM/ murein hydrolase activator NlpD
MAFIPSPPSRPSVTVHFQRRGRTRQINLGGTASLVLGACLVVLGIWALAATIYLAFRDDVVGSVLQRQQQWRYAYEDRIAALRAQMDRVTSRQLVDQDGFEGKVQELMARQAQLETRQAVVNALMTQATASLAPKNAASRPVAATPADPIGAKFAASHAAALPRGAAAYAGAESPESLAGLPTLRGSGAASDGPFQPLPPSSQKRAGGPLPFDPALPGPDNGQRAALESGRRIGQLERSLDGFATRQEASLAAVEGTARAETLRLKGLVAELGLDDRRFRPRTPAGASDMANEGGPFVPVPLDAEDGSFSAALERLQRSVQDAERMRQVVASIPLARPLPGDPEVTSTFGTRIDPFTRGVALHTGIDLRDEYGAAVRATAPGVITSADWKGGYGNMVEVDHGHGLATRYGHLSSISVAEGEHVEAGTVVGRLGSTGRSTGPHLHYETRVDGEAVDPVRFLRVAKRLAGS